MEETATLNCPATQDFEARVREHQAGVRAFIRALGVDEAWVDDLAQEAFIVAYRRLNQFEPGTDFGKWLRSIARYLVANERRKEARHSRLLPFAVVDALLAHEPESGVETRISDLLPAIGEADVDSFISHAATARGVSVESLAPFRNMLVGGIVQSMDEKSRDAWARNQVYIALGNLLTSAAGRPLNRFCHKSWLRITTRSFPG